MRHVRFNLALGAVALAAASLRGSAASACSSASTVYVTDSTQMAVDTQPPSTPQVGQVVVERGNQGGCASMGTSCDDIGSARIAVQATDDRTTASDVGFKITVVDGTAPFGLSPLGMPTARDLEGSITLIWIDDTSMSTEPVQFSVQIQAVDRAGNVSPAGATVAVHAPGSSACAITPRGGRGSPSLPGVAAALALAAAWLASRRRPRKSDIPVRIAAPGGPGAA